MTTTLAYTHHSATHSTGIGGDLAHTFAHAATRAFAWRGVGELFHAAHGLGLIIVIVLALAAAVYLFTHRHAH